MTFLHVKTLVKELSVNEADEAVVEEDVKMSLAGGE